MNEYFLETKYIISGSKCDKLIRDGAILVENDKIVDVGKSKDIKKLISGHDKIERNNHIAIPSFINAHTHLPETLLRGSHPDHTSWQSGNHPLHHPVARNPRHISCLFF